ncbi:hypothetical protein EC957_011236, partial [Mortierella hygrophila]
PVPVPVRVSTAPSDIIRPGTNAFDIMDVIKRMQGAFHPRTPGLDTQSLSRIMPWQERPMDVAIDRVVTNVRTCQSWRNYESPAKAESTFLVCSGTAGIGKTRYGRELYGTLRRQLSEKAKAKGIDYSPHYHYMMLDFGNNAKLSSFDSHLDADTILGLRLAYAHFFGDRYDQGISDFCFGAMEHLGFFSIHNVISAIRQDLQLPAYQSFFLFLHIDEFQRILDHRWRGTPKGHKLASLPDVEFRLAGNITDGHTDEGLRLFQDMMRSLGPFMSGAVKPHMVQTFLSGTARQDVTQVAEPTSYSFEFLSCPTLSTGACYDIMGHFTELAKVPHHQWMPKTAFLHLLSSTGGLPRALQLLLEEFFGGKLEKCDSFVDTVANIHLNADRIFDKVANILDNFYSISDFATTHKELVGALVRLCILQQPTPRTFAPSEQFPALTLDVLERNTHTILENTDKGRTIVLVRIPYFFLHVYNTAIDAVLNSLGSAFLHTWVEDREWVFFERIIAEYEAFRTNLLVDGGRETATLGEIYQGALGRKETLNRTVQLKKLSVVKAAHRFPEWGGLAVGEQDLDWRSGVVIKNADGAQFGDVCVYRESADGEGDNLLCALQAKKLGTPLSATLLTIEHRKNTHTIEEIAPHSLLDQQGIKQTRTITILISTADMTDSAFQQLSTSIPHDCLLIYQGNFHEFFGDTFSISAALAVSKDLNWNFATQETLKKKRWLRDEEVHRILQNMPYRSYEDLVQKVPSMRSKDHANDMGFLPYQDFQHEKRRRVE